MVELVKKGLATLLWVVVFSTSATALIILCRMRILGLRRVPRRGPVLVVANHHSFLDPVMVGVSVSRRATYLARASLFNNPLFAWLPAGLGAIRLHRDATTTEALKTALKRLADGKVVIMFPEGTRSPTRELGELRGGVLLLARKTNATIIVAGIAGSFDCWPRTRRLPWPCPMVVHFEPWKYPETNDSKAALADLEHAIRSGMAKAEELRRNL